MKKLNHRTIKVFFFRSIIIIMCLWCTIIGKAQKIQVTAESNAQNLVQTIVGAGVTVKNVTKNCDNRATGTFTAGEVPVGIPEGIILSTGTATDPGYGLNDIGASFALSNISYPPLSALSANGSPSRDACVIEFDLVAPVNATKLQFKYNFGSDEYDEFADPNDLYNDVFAFWVEGPGINGRKNIALLPSSNIPVSIQTVNKNTNNQYYTNQNNGPKSGYDGMLKPLIAEVTVQSQQTYHMILAISDIQDQSYSSAVFIQKSSVTFDDPPIVYPTLDNPVNTGALCQGYIFENTGKAEFTFRLPQNTTTNKTFNIRLKGTAVNGTDYQNIGSTITIPAGQSSVKVTLQPKTDNIFDPNETFTICLLDATNNEIGCKSVTIVEGPYTFIAPDKTCADANIELYEPNFGATYSWTISGLHTLGNQGGKKYVSFPYPGKYTIKVTLNYPSGCSYTTSKKITVDPCDKDFSCCASDFAPDPGKYYFSGWVSPDRTVTSLSDLPYYSVVVNYADGSIKKFPMRAIEYSSIDEWYNIQGYVNIDLGALDITVNLVNPSDLTAYFDDIRMQPFNSSMKGYVFDNVNKRMVAELDESNYATFYEYDEEGQLIRIKKETEKGILTIQESFQNTRKQ